MENVKKEGDEVSQDGLKDEADIERELEEVTLEESKHGAEGHTHQQKRSRQNEHDKIDGLPPEKAPIFFDLKDNIEGAAQRTENPGGGPEESADAQRPTIRLSSTIFKMLFLILGSMAGNISFRYSLM